MPQLSFHVDKERCIKCWACEIACKQWNGISAGTVSRRVVYEETSGTYPDVTREFLSVSCMHCVNAPCVEVCPTGALVKRDDDGIVIVNQEDCTSCQSCLEACPFDIPQFTDDGMDKCDCCIGIGIEPGDTPRCVLACPTQALQFGMLADDDIDVTALTIDEMLSLELSSINDVGSLLINDATVVLTVDDLSADEAAADDTATEEDDDC